MQVKNQKLELNMEQWPGSKLGKDYVKAVYCHPAYLTYMQSTSGGTSSKEPACQCRRCKKSGFNPWVGKIPWRRAWQPTPVFLPGESQGRGSLVGCRLWGRTESDMTEMT